MQVCLRRSWLTAKEPGSFDTVLLLDVGEREGVVLLHQEFLHEVRQREDLHAQLRPVPAHGRQRL